MKMKTENVGLLIVASIILTSLIVLYHIISTHVFIDEDSTVRFMLSRRVCTMLEYLTGSIYITCIGITSLACAVILWERRKAKR